ncbi:GLPGLI family protein [Chryseobacterium sp. T1]
MRKYLLLLVFFSLLFSAQNQRYIYEYKIIKDSTDRDNVRNEMMFLDTSKEGSRYYSYTAYHSDSLMLVSLEQQLKATGMINIKSDMKKEAVRYSVSKTYPDYKVNLHNKIGTDNYNISEDRKFNWSITSDKQKIGKWNTQKATLDFAGRQWTAWFTTEIPLQDGPYKFSGLPGLIVKIEDKSQSHILELRGIKTISDAEYNAKSKPKKEVSLNLKQYQKIITDYENDPTKGLKQASMGNITMLPAEGGDNRWIKEREESLKKELKKDNNKIELSFK